MNITSDNIQVFPSTRRSSYQVSARLMSESSFTNIVNRLIDTDGFVITPDTDVATSQESHSTATAYDVFEFNVHGYYFKISDIREVFNSFTSAISIYAKIVLDTPSFDSIYYELQGQDTNDGTTENPNYHYYGVEFTSSLPSGSNTYYLKLFERAGTSSAWTVPSDSRIKFRYGLQSVDGGEITLTPNP